MIYKPTCTPLVFQPRSSTIQMCHNISNLMAQNYLNRWHVYEKERRTGLWQTEYICDNPWHKYSVAVNLVMIGTRKRSKWWLRLYHFETLGSVAPCRLSPTFYQWNTDMKHKLWNIVSNQLSYVNSVCRCCWNVAT